MSNPLLLPIGLVIFLVMALAAAATARSIRAAQRRRNRRIELPNSHYTAARVRERETLDRWQDMPLDRIHPVNRDEVLRLLAKIEAGGAGALRPQERTFLDTMRRLAGG